MLAAENSINKLKPKGQVLSQMFFLQVKSWGSQRSSESQKATQWGEVRNVAGVKLCFVPGCNGTVNFSLIMSPLSVETVLCQTVPNTCAWWRSFYLRAWGCQRGELGTGAQCQLTVCKGCPLSLPWWKRLRLGFTRKCIFTRLLLYQFKLEIFTPPPS